MPNPRVRSIVSTPKEGNCPCDRWLRPDKAAARTGTTPGFIEDAMRSGDLPFRIAGDRRVIDAQDLDLFMEKLPKQTRKLPGRGKFAEKIAA